MNPEALICFSSNDLSLDFDPGFFFDQAKK